MSKLSKLFTGYFGGGRHGIMMPGYTTKTNDSHDKHGRPTVTNGYSFRCLRRWFGNKEFVNDMVASANRCNYPAIEIKIACDNAKDNLPSYMNPVYRRAYHEPKRKK